MTVIANLSLNEENHDMIIREDGLVLLKSLATCDDIKVIKSRSRFTSCVFKRADWFCSRIRSLSALYATRLRIFALTRTILRKFLERAVWL